MKIPALYSKSAACSLGEERAFINVEEFDMEFVEFLEGVILEGDVCQTGSEHFLVLNMKHYCGHALLGNLKVFQEAVAAQELG